MKIFVTGGAGFIGSNFVRHVLCLNKGYKIVIYDKLTYAGNLANLESVSGYLDYSFVRGSICDASAVEKAMNGCDVVVHFAAESHVDRSIYEPAPVIDTNVTGTFVMLQVARKLHIERFVMSRPTKCTATGPPALSPMKIRRCSPAAPTRRRRPARICWFCPMCAPTASRA